MITPDAVEDLRLRVVHGQLSARERAVLGDLIVALDAAVHVHRAGPGLLWALVARQFRVGKSDIPAERAAVAFPRSRPWGISRRRSPGHHDRVGRNVAWRYLLAGGA